MHIPHVPQHASVPPPFAFELTDGDRHVGWVKGSRLVFLGFQDEAQAAHAAWMAHRALVERIVESFGAKSPPLEGERLMIAPRGTHDVVCADGREIATLLRPGSEPMLDRHFGFDLRVPAPHDELTMRATAYAIYRKLRKSGLPWALFSAGPDDPPPPPPSSGTRLSLGMRLAAAAGLDA